MKKIIIGIVIALSIIGVGSFLLLMLGLSLRDLALYTHLFSLGLSVCGIILADHTGFTWIRGKVDIVRPKTLHLLHWAVGIGLGLMIGSGSVLFWLEHAYLLGTIAFYIKMAFVVALLLNSFFIERLMHTATIQPFNSLTASKKIHFYISGAISTFCWFGAFVSAFFLS